MEPGWKQAGTQPLPSLTVEHMKSSWYAQQPNSMLWEVSREVSQAAVSATSKNCIIFNANMGSAHN